MDGAVCNPAVNTQVLPAVTFLTVTSVTADNRSIVSLSTLQELTIRTLE